MRVRFSAVLAATLLVLCLGFQALEATGWWDRTLQDAGDEAVIVTVVLCVGAALVAARAVCRVPSLALIRSRIVSVRAAAIRPVVHDVAWPVISTSPPFGLRI